MSIRDRKWWLVRLKRDNVISNQLIHVVKIDEFRELLPPDVEVVYYGQASWQTMNHLTGCVIEDMSKSLNYADGPLSFIRNQQEVKVYPY